MPHTNLKVTVGGDRLGSGNKLTQDLKTFNKSTHDLSYMWRTTMSAGTLVPFMTEIALPGDTFDIDLKASILTHPTLGPLFGSMKVQLDLFLTPIRLYNGVLHNDALNMGMQMDKVYLPQMKLTALPIPANMPTSAITTYQINPSSLLSYLGINGIGIMGTGTPPEREFNAIPLLAYWDIFKNYYANKQETNAYYIATTRSTKPTVATLTDVKANGNALPQTVHAASPISVSSTTPIEGYWVTLITDKGEFQLPDLAAQRAPWTSGSTLWTYNAPYDCTITAWRITEYWELPKTPPTLRAFSLDIIDTMRQRILQGTTTAAPLDVNAAAAALPTPNPYKDTIQGDTANAMTPYVFNQQGLAVKTYQSDLFNNWISIANFNTINNKAKIDTSAGNFTIDQLNLTQKVYELLNQIAITGGSYDDWLTAVYNSKRIRQAETPMYMGGMSQELIFQEVINNSQASTSTGVQPLGTLAGKGTLANNKRGGHVIINVDEPSYIIGIVSITPRVDYSQGNIWSTSLRTLDDLHKPALDQIGFQDLIAEQLAWFSTTVDSAGIPTRKSVGKQPSWINYMTNVNRVHGNFAIQDNEMFMTLNRRYEYDPATKNIKDLTSYIDPAKFNQIFAETDLNGQNYWAQIAVNMNVRRLISAKQIPAL